MTHKKIGPSIAFLLFFAVTTNITCSIEINPNIQAPFVQNKPILKPSLSPTPTLTPATIVIKNHQPSDDKSKNQFKLILVGIAFLGSIYGYMRYTNNKTYNDINKRLCTNHTLLTNISNLIKNKFSTTEKLLEGLKKFFQNQFEGLNKTLNKLFKTQKEMAVAQRKTHEELGKIQKYINNNHNLTTTKLNEMSTKQQKETEALKASLQTVQKTNISINKNINHIQNNMEHLSSLPNSVKKINKNISHIQNNIQKILDAIKSSEITNQ